jgi:hypothetical protein
MSPFDPVALTAMLRAFYPLASAADLARARRERPEYFGGGRLGGADGTLLELPDGRIYRVML